MLRIYELLEEKGILFRTLASQLGFTRQSLHSICIGNPTLNNIERVAEGLGVSTWRLLFSDEEVIKDLHERGKLPKYCPSCGEDVMPKGEQQE